MAYLGHAPDLASPRLHQPNQILLNNLYIIAVFNNVGKAAFLGPNQNLRHFGQPNGKANKFANSYCINTILGDSELLEVGLPEYVKKNAERQ